MTALLEYLDLLLQDIGQGHATPPPMLQNAVYFIFSFFTYQVLQ